jgi:inward rectifier potassium channel
MAVSNHRQRLRDIDNTGFGPNSSVEGGRLVNADGSTNLRKRGIPFWERISIYHSLLRMKRSHFFLTIILFYSSINLVYAMLYLAAGVEHLSGIDGGQNAGDRFMEAFFFSSQTLTTVGYGRVAPTGMMTNIIASSESLLGILSFALVTGIVYGRFARPRAYLVFSPNILVAPYKGGKGLMLRIATYKNNHLTDVEALLTLALHVKEHDKTVTRFYPLSLEFAKINSLALSWTIVHHINEESPLYNFTREEVAESKMEVIVNIKAFDDHFSNIVQQRTSYTHNQVIYGARFLPMFERATNGDYTLLELNKINAHELVKLPEHAGVAS